MRRPNLSKRIGDMRSYLSLSGVRLALDGALGVTSSSGAISQWNDQSASANNATQATGANKPTATTSALLGGNAVASLNGTSNFMNLASVVTAGGSGNKSSVGAVFVNKQTSGTGSIISVTGFRLLNILGGKWSYYSQQSDNGAVSTLANNTPYCLVAVQQSNTLVNTWTNGTKFDLTSTVVGVSDNPSTVGANSNGINQWGQVDLGLLVIANTNWSAQEVDAFRRYCNRTFGFAA